MSSKRYEHIEGTTVDAVFSNCKKYRYKLTVQNDNSSGSENRLCCHAES